MVPAMCGLAIEVPEMTSAWLPGVNPDGSMAPVQPVAAEVQVWPVWTEVMLRPGAAMSGLTRSGDPKIWRGPREEKLARVSAPEGPSSVALRVAMLALSVLPSASVTRTAGMVMVGSVPPRPAGGDPGALSAMMTPTAPAFCAFFTLTVKAQVPRSMSAMLPATAAALVSAVQASVVSGPAALAASSATTTLWGPGGVPLGVTAGPNVAPAARKSPAIAAGVFTWTIGAGSPASSEAAAVMAPPATPGEPAMKKVSLELPAEIATITPAAAAFWAAIAVGLVTVPKSEPSDMLITSRWSDRSPSPSGSIAQSMAWTTTPVLPPQPNTRRA